MVFAFGDCVVLNLHSCHVAYEFLVLEFIERESITFFLLIAANIKERKNQRWLLLFIVFQTLYLLTFIFQYDGWPSLLVFVTSSVNLLCVWWLSPQNMRFIGGINSIFFLLYQISIKNWAGLIEILVVLSNLLSYLKYRKK